MLANNRSPNVVIMVNNPSGPNEFTKALDVLSGTGVKIVPPRINIVKTIPRFILVAAMRVLLATKFAEVGGGWHCSQAPDEMHQLGIELIRLVQKSGLPVPALRKLFAPGL